MSATRTYPAARRAPCSATSDRMEADEPFRASCCRRSTSVLAALPWAGEPGLDPSRVSEADTMSSTEPQPYISRAAAMSSCGMKRSTDAAAGSVCSRMAWGVVRSMVKAALVPPMIR